MALIQPILSEFPEYGHDETEVLFFREFMDLLNKEEQYFHEDLLNIRRIVTRLRKIFYDKFGWNSQLIKKAACIKGRYKVKIVDCNPTITEGRTLPQHIKRYINKDYKPKCRIVTYRYNDRVYKNSKQGEVPHIYAKDHQDILLPEGYHCDFGHVLAGLDALNNPQTVTPLPGFLSFLFPNLPCVNSNADVCTWLGDIATIAMDFLFFFLKHNRHLNEDEKQFYINSNASASDMLGNIDGYVINYLYKTGTTKDRNFVDIIEEYYGDAETPKKRIAIFCACVRLKNWDGKHFSNEQAWLVYYADQLRATITFMVFSSTHGFPDRFRLPLQVWQRKFETIIEVEMLMNLFLSALKKLL